ncbi:TetR/AcrR family transcriptional regulator [Falsibacillus pallidus]|uniref:TetR family transcriptional regulator n=1 Tax=Falsibacillus pallidus TaxID=493781 RepID=A0A370GHV4_9BACI|nr:TetR/AcrR family transcriptional regulator [Falsibacillus pallidus]RDI41954.1 TetR family transcriptional regulator [Falsibacillus pallidus]
MSEENQMLNLLIENQDGVTEKQKKILEAAVEIFSEKGYAASSTSEIAKKAGVAEGTIFRHYKTKKDLLFSIVAPTMTKLIAPFIIRDLNKVLDKDYEEFEDFLRAIIANRQAFAKENTNMIKILVQEIPFHPELKEQFTKNIALKVFERLKEVVVHYQKNGQIIELPPESVVRMLGSTIIGYLLARHIMAPEADWNDEKEIENMISFILNGIKK